MRNNEIFHEKLRRFWKPGDEIICTRIFRHSANNCYLCGHTPLEWHHVLLNTISNQTIDVELSCVINMKKVLESMGSKQSILFFPQYTDAVNRLNLQYPGTASIVEFNPNPDVMVRLLSRPEDLCYKQIRPILDHTCKFNDEFMTEIFSAALDIYVDRKYYIYDYLEEHEKIGSAEQSIALHLQKEWEREMYGEDYHTISSKSDVKDEDLPF